MTTCSIVALTKSVRKASLGVRDEEAMSGGTLWLSTDGFDDARLKRSTGHMVAGFGQAVVELSLEERDDGRAELVFERGLSLDGTDAVGEQFGKFCRCLRCHRMDWQSDHGGKVGDEARMS